MIDYVCLKSVAAFEVWNSKSISSRLKPEFEELNLLRAGEGNGLVCDCA